MNAATSRPIHHPDDDLLSAYYQGRAMPGEALLIETHLNACAECRHTLKLYDGIGAALLEDIEAVDISEDAVELAMARIERPYEAKAPLRGESVAPHRMAAFLEGFDLPERITRAIKGRYWVAPGVWIAPVAVANQPRGAKTYLMNVAPGMVMPLHDHRGSEMTLVLQGGFKDVGGEYDAGDIVRRLPGDEHSPEIDPKEGCLSLVTQSAPIRPMTFLGWLLQPIARI